MGSAAMTCAHLFLGILLVPLLAGSIVVGQNKNDVTSISSDGTTMALQDDDFPQRKHFEADLTKQLNTIIPNTPVRKLMAHEVHILKMDCMAPAFQVACAKLISRIGLLMRTFRQREKESSSLWKSYVSPSRNVPNTISTSSQKLERPWQMKGSQGLLEYKYRTKLMLAVLVTSIACISLIMTCSQHCATFLGRRKKPLPDEELPNTGSLLMNKSPPLRAAQPLGRVQKNLADKVHYEGSSKAEEIPRWGTARPSLPESPENELSSNPSSVPTLELLQTAAPPPPPPPPLPPPSASPPKPSVKTDSNTVGGTSEATSTQPASSTAEQGEDDKVDDEDSPETSDSLTTEATNETPQTGEAEEEDEDSD